MPELPDVEVFRKIIEKNAVGKTIDDFTIVEKKVVKISKKTLTNIKGNKVDSTLRRGKYCFTEIDNFGWLILHFGMTGSVSFYEEEDEKPDYSAFLLHFRQNGILSFISKRKLGKIDTCDSPENFAKENDIGKDALEIYQKEFLALMKEKRGGIKSALMDQSVLSGVGNVYSDEILFQCKLHPKADIKGIDEDKRKELYEKMTEVLKNSIEVDGNPAELPKNYLIPVRNEGEKCPYCSGEVRKIKISGRGCYYCPSCQVK